MVRLCAAKLFSNGAPLRVRATQRRDVRARMAEHESGRIDHALNMSILPHALSGEVFGQRAKSMLPAVVET